MTCMHVFLDNATYHNKDMKFIKKTAQEKCQFGCFDALNTVSCSSALQ